ncbi:MAG: hypothetical protein M1407_05540, partial [Deltaproteobacteria bacterium]|nr:hypothetical protein [Deltaproteobacteria bacterium]
IIYLLKKSCHYNFMKTNIFTILLSGIIMICGIENRKRCQSQEKELREQLEYIDENIKKLKETEEYLNIEREKLQFLFDIELLFDTLMEAKNYSSGIYLKKSGTD